MKKICLFVVLAVFLSFSSVFAQDMGIQLINPEAGMAFETVSLDDMKIDTEAEIDGYGILKPKSFEYNNYLMVYKQGRNDTENKHDSGNEAEYAILYFDITNNTLTPRDYLTNYEVKVVYDDLFEYAGWAYQQNYDYEEWNSYYEYAPYAHQQNKLYGIDPADNFKINPMYQGHYIFGCTLPNAVVNSKKPLRMEITLDGNELTYNIRK